MPCFLEGSLISSLRLRPRRASPEWAHRDGAGADREARGTPLNAQGRPGERLFVSALENARRKAAGAGPALVRVMEKTAALSLIFGMTVACSGGVGGPSATDSPPTPPPAQTNSPDGGSADSGVSEDSRAQNVDAGDNAADAGTAGDSGTTTNRDFVETVIDDTGVHGQGAELVDIDLDGDLDVVCAFSLTDSVRIYLNDGDGRSFTMIEPIPEGTIVAMHAVAADLDGDRDLDLAVVGLFDRSVGFSSAGEVTWFENPGDLSSTWPRHEITGLSFWAPLIIRAGDLTGDGRPDLVVSSIEIGGQGNGLFWFRNTGAGFAGPFAVEATLGYVSSAFVHDVDGDMDLDIVASSYSGGELVWYENQRGGTDEAPTFSRHIIATIPGPYALVLGQMDDDAELEAIATSAGGGGQIAWFDPGGDPRGPWTERAVASGRGEGEVRLAAGDFDADGRPDVAMTAFAQGEIVLLVGSGNNAFTPLHIARDYVGANWIVSGDVDGDGGLEVITTTYDFPGGDRIGVWHIEP